MCVCGCECVCVCDILFIHPLDKYVGCFYLLAIVNCASMNLGLQIHFDSPDFNYLGYIPQSGIPESYMAILFVFFEEPPYYFPQQWCCILLPTVHSCPVSL